MLDKLSFEFANRIALKGPRAAWLAGLCFMLLAGIGAVPSLVSQALAYSPATGPIATSIIFGAATSATHGPYSLTKSGATITVSRPDLPNFIFDGTGTAPVLRYAFIGTDWLLIKTTDSNLVDIDTTLDWVRLDVDEPVKNIYSRTDFVTQGPNSQVFRNSDGLAFFTKHLLNDIPGSDVFEIEVYRTDTGDSLCSMAPVDRSSGDTITAALTGTDVIITFNHPPFSPILRTCALPVANLAVSPDPLDFGEIRADTTDDRPATLTNSGSDSITINSIGSAGAFSPVGFAPVILGAGDSTTVTIRFNPANVVGSFDELLPVSRTPAVGASSIHAIGSSRDPNPHIVVTPLSQSIAFGLTNVGTTATRTLTLANDGDLPLAITASAGPTSAVYSVTPAIAPRTIAAGASVAFTVSFTPAATIIYPDSIVLTTNDPLNPTVTITISGQGHIPLPKFVVDPTVSLLDYGDVEIGYRFGKGIRIRNEGDAALIFDVSVAGDGRFSFSQTPTMPGPGVRSAAGVTIPASPLGGPFNELILRVTFDATGPIGGPYTGTLAIGNINDATAAPVAVSLTGSVIAGKTLDVVLVLDRSGSMSETTGLDSKIGAVKRASRLFFNLLRPDVGDRAALVQFNTAADLLMPLTAITAASRADFVAEIDDATNLDPSGATSITAGLLAAFGELTDTARDVRAVLIVSDGKENTPATLPGGGTATLDTVALPAGVGVHSLGLGRTDNIDVARLENIATRSGGTSNTTGDLQGLDLFGVEKFFLQMATTILGGTPVLDPVITIQPGQTFTSTIPLIAADKEVTFVLLYKNGVLPYRIVAPDGTTFPAAAPPPGFAQTVFEPANASIVRLKLPTEKPELYENNWQIVVTHPHATFLGPGPKRDPRETNDPVDYGLYIGVLSNLRLLGLLSPQPVLIGDPILVTGFLSEEGIPVLNANIDVTVTHPNQSTSALALHDDGAHNDGAANDGEYAAEFRQTAAAGGYSFTYHAFGTSARGGTFVRETSLGKHVIGRGGGGPEAGAPRYTVKFVCGKSDGKILAPGSYFTAINVHNTTDRTIEFKKRFAIALPGEKAGPVSRTFAAKLGPDQALEIDCPDIRERLAKTYSAGFFKGFVIIESNVKLDLVAVYTAADGTGAVKTMDIERIAPNR